MWFVDHPRCNQFMGAPPGREADVATLRIEDKRDGPFGRQMTSFWKPNETDLALLNAGGVVALSIHSAVHPVLSMSVEKAD